MENFRFNPQKNIKLKQERGINFDDIVNALNMGGLLEVRPHHNSRKYPDQKVLIVEINHYVYQVPYVDRGDFLELKTVFPSRKFTKIHLQNKTVGGNS